MAAPMRSRRSSRRGLLALLGVSIVFAADVTQEQCEKWAASGECEKNSKFMLVTCREACASNHRRSPDYAAAYHCELWAGEGECAANVPFMNRECARACGDRWLWVPEVRRGLGLPWPLPTYDAPDAPAATRGDDGSLELDARAALASAATPARSAALDDAALSFPPVAAAAAGAGAAAPEKALAPSRTTLPTLGVGTCWLSEAESEAAVDAALAYLRSRPKGPGVHVDSAEAYRNEAAIGRAIAKDPATASRLFLASKISDEKSLGYEGARRRVQETLRNFGVDRVDLYYLHSPFGFNRGEKTRVADAWRALVELRDGHDRALGLSNFNATCASSPTTRTSGLRMPDVVQNKFDPTAAATRARGATTSSASARRRRRRRLLAALGWPFGVGALADPPRADCRGERRERRLRRLEVGPRRHAAIPRSSNASHVRANLAVLDAWPAPLAPAERAAIDGLNHLVAFRENVAAGPDALGVKAASKPGRAEL
ncbi:oxidoreductase [Aureococcus anophagefferens]|nr:oxidoreductase [Aureococcus anophagefferens]